jgi:hypothetical protein
LRKKFGVVSEGRVNNVVNYNINAFLIQN